MPFIIDHTVASGTLKPTAHNSRAGAFFRVRGSGAITAIYPGALSKWAWAQFSLRTKILDDAPHSGHGGFNTTTKEFPVNIRVFTPDGLEFTQPVVTIEDLYRFRDLRGVSAGDWTWSIEGESSPVSLNDGTTVSESMLNERCTFGVSIEEHVHSESAGSLIADAPLTGAPARFTFDLFRVGTLVANILHPPLLHLWRGTMRLLDPDGALIASTTSDAMRVPIDLRRLDVSRDAQGHVRVWTLEVIPLGGIVTGAPRLNATVIADARTTTATVQARIDRLLGPHGAFLKIYGENKDGQVAARLVITDVVSAETLDMHGVLEKQLKKYPQQPPAAYDEVHAHLVYTLASLNESKLGYGLKIEAGSFKVDTIAMSVGPAVRLGAVPAVRLLIKASGEIAFKLGPTTVCTASLKEDNVEVEIGIRLSADGVPEIVTWMPDSPFDIDLHWTTILVLGVIAGPIVAAGADTAMEVIEGYINGQVVAGTRALFAQPGLASQILMTLFGGHFTYRAITTNGVDIQTDYIAPLEPDPRRNDAYHGVIGRSFTQLGPEAIEFNPRTLGDTWKRDNLSKIKHVVVVMMENRSYDHTLGYRARSPINDGADGLTDATIAAIEAASPREPVVLDPDMPSAPLPLYDVRPFREANFPPNDAGMMTRLPRGVGHDFAAVTEQLGSGRVPGPGGRQINSPAGFFANFARKLTQDDTHGVEAKDVLGYYEAEDLPFFKYLAENYAYCDRYFCSHPGPTMPNRMFSLSGDLQHDRLNVPIFDNNHGDNFQLSRALTIYDFLTRKGVGWRVYESDPSVTMLRMYARYATDNVNIRSFSRLAEDVANGDLPAFVAIEPAMHHHPQNDDHPDADMLRGQEFLRDVYLKLRSNRALWAETMLIITYDEHGGLYDHVTPPVADLLTRPMTNFDPDSGSTPPAAHGPATIPVIYGVRVPTFVVSPWSEPGKGPSITLDHCSILKTALVCLLGQQKPFFADRVNASQSFESYLTSPEARLDLPEPDTLPQLPADARRLIDSPQTRIDTPILTRKQMRNGPVDYHELTGRLARMLGR